MINISTLPNFLTVQEVATILRVNDCTVRRWVASGKLEAIQLPSNSGGRRKFRILRSSFVSLFGEPVNA